MGKAKVFRPCHSACQAFPHAPGVVLLKDRLSSPTVRNFTGRTITGLEIKGSVVDHDGKPVKENTVIVIPIKQIPELEPNKTMHASVLLEGFTDSDDRANIKIEVTGFTLR